jgi:hypothetical protein
MLLAKESDVAEVIVPAKLQQKVKALELLALISDHPACWQAIKDRAAHLQLELEAELAADVVAVAKVQGKSLLLEAVVVEILR